MKALDRSPELPDVTILACRSDGVTDLGDMD